MIIIISVTVIGVLIAVFSIFATRKKTQQGLKVRVNKLKRPESAFEITVKGALNNRKENVRYTIMIADETAQEPTPIRCEVGISNETNTEVKIQTPDHEISRNAVLTEWTKILTIPTSKIEPGLHGNRMFAFRVQVNSQPTIARGTATHHYTEKGFLDIKGKLPEIYKSIFYLIDGLRSTVPADSFDLKKVKEWLLAEGKDWTEEERTDIIKEFKSILLSPLSLVSWDEAREFYSVSVRRYANQKLRNHVIQLFFQLLENASSALPEERRLEMLYNLSQAIDTNMGQFCRMAERVFSESFHQMHDNCRLGIHDEMSADEIRKRLKEEYKTWNTRVTHQDQTLRKQAEEMLELIAQKQCELPNKAA